nr:hydroxyacid dehydrogenase [Pigmentibacter ruber]
MNNNIVAVASPSFSQSSILVNELSSYGFKVVLNSKNIRFNEKSLIEFINECEAKAIVIGLEKVSEKVLTSCKSLNFISKFGVGLDNLDLNACEKNGIKIGWTPGLNNRSVTELVLSFTLGHLRNSTKAIYEMSKGIWNKNGGKELSKCIFGIVGLGNIGMDLARVLKGFGCNILYYDIIDKSMSEEVMKLGFQQVTYQALLKESDVISFHVPLTEQTQYMFSSEQLSIVKPDCFIINTSRGAVVDFDKVCSAVLEKRLGGFASDVFLEEPYDASRWSEVSNLYFTPHIGGNSKEAVLNMGRSAINHIANYFGKINNEK